MHDDIQQRRLERLSGTSSIARRREILKRIGKTSLLAGAAASPLAAMAGGSGPPFCRNVIDTTKCVHASVSGMASIVLSAQAGNEVCSHKCSHYGNSGNWPGTCSNGSTSITCNTKFKTAFKCPANATDSNGTAIGVAGCLLDQSLLTLCTSYSGTPEAHWACALGNANKCVGVSGFADFPYPPATVVDGHYQNAGLRAQAYTFYSNYCESQA